MMNPPSAADAAALEQCIDEMDQCIDTLARYPAAVLAFAMRSHLGALLRAMADDRICSREDVRQFLVELEREALGVGEE
jgi:hypothetical protein